MADPVTNRPDRAAALSLRWDLVFVAWTAYGLLSAAQHHVSYAMSRGVTLPWSLSLLVNMPVAWGWALATPAIVWLGRRFRFERRRWPISVAVHVAACLSWVLLLEVFYAWHTANVLPQAGPARPVLDRALQLAVGWVLAYGFFYWSILSVSYAVERQQRLRERELAASQLETQLVEADLQALKMQLHPHFLFNALHTIGSLVRTGDREGAIRVVAGLGDLLRRLLDDTTQQEVPLRQELDFVRSYLDIEQVRFRDRLCVEMDVHPDTLDVPVPHLILQPLVENAIRHGIAPHRAAGWVVVSAQVSGDRLVLSVLDNGPGVVRSAAVTTRPGIGLANTRARLQRLYEGDFELHVGNAEEGGHVARIVLPMRLATVARGAGT